MRSPSVLLRLMAAISPLLAPLPVFGAAATNPPTPGDRQLAEYFRAETLRLQNACLQEVQSLTDWNARKDTYRQQLFEMLGLAPLPPKTDLKPVVTGRIEHEQFTVEKLHFQSMPQLYVTANLYVPKKLERPAPAILYVCGHSVMKTNGVSLGNKTGYQHHGAWFAQHGYVCLTIDTIQLGELPGIHHGTYREGMWWWNARGYTPAGVEAWNSIRALDYLQSRPEVDGLRLGVTGRSGGGAYSWWVAALDERIKAACPVAGITDLHNHVIDGTVQGHCDCMFTVNTYRWDYAQVAALVAPRPLLICNTDKDGIFPLEGVVRLHNKVRNIYRLHNAANKLGLLITEGPHKDTQDLQVPVFRWFNRHLKGEEPLIEVAAEKLFMPADLKVFNELPADERTTKIHETFVPLAPKATVPADREAWAKQRDDWLRLLREKCFRGWPEEPAPIELNEAWVVVRDGVRFAAYDFTSQEYVHLRLYVADANRPKPQGVTLRLLDESTWPGWLDLMSVGFAKELAEENRIASLLTTPTPKGGHRDSQFTQWRREIQSGNRATAWLAPRGIGLTAWNPTERQKPHINRRFMLLGQTVDTMRTWDIHRAVQALHGLAALRGVPLEIEGRGRMAGNALYAALFEPDIAGLHLRDLPPSHREGPDYLNVLRFLDVPQAVALAADRGPVRLSGDQPAAVWEYPRAVAARLGWPENRLRIDTEAGD